MVLLVLAVCTHITREEVHNGMVRRRGMMYAHGRVEARCFLATQMACGKRVVCTCSDP